MTRDEVMALSKGELRVEIAKALGFMGVHHGDNDTLWGHKTINSYQYSDLPDWPNDIKAAFDLAENVRSQGYTFDLSMDEKVTGKQDRVMVMFSIISLDLPYPIQAEAETAPLAISRAWLIWKKESEK